MKYNKVVIWGYPLYSHTHSYVHYGYYQAFKSLGYDTYWFNDDDYPETEDFTNTLFIGEGFADKNLPINDSSAYFIMYCPSPEKYLEAERYIDVRTVGVGIKDHIYDYSLDKTKTLRVGPGCYFESKTDKVVHIKNDYHDYTMKDYDKLYISWATNLLPDQIDPNNITLPRKNVVHYLGLYLTLEYVKIILQSFLLYRNVISTTYNLLLMILGKILCPLKKLLEEYKSQF